MVKFEIDDELMEWAERRDDELPPIRNPVTHVTKQHSLSGMIGECMFKRIRPKSLWVSGFNYDFISRGKNIEIKTKVVTTPPCSHHNVNVSGANPRQKADFYVFACVLRNHSIGWLVGWLGCDEFFNIATRKKQGDTEPNGFEYKCETWVVQISQLREIN